MRMCVCYMLLGITIRVNHDIEFKCTLCTRLDSKGSLIRGVPPPPRSLALRLYHG